MDSIENVAAELTQAAQGLPVSDAAEVAFQIGEAADAVLRIGKASPALGEVAAHLTAGSDAALRAAEALATGQDKIRSYLGDIGASDQAVVTDGVAGFHEGVEKSPYEGWGFAGEFSHFVNAHVRRLTGRGLREPDASNLRTAAQNIRDELMLLARDGRGQLVPIAELAGQLAEYRRAIIEEDPVALSRLSGGTGQRTLTPSLVSLVISDLNRVPGREAFWEITDAEENHQRETLEPPAAIPAPREVDTRAQLIDRIIEATRDNMIVTVHVPGGDVTQGFNSHQSSIVSPWQRLKVSTLNKNAWNAETTEDIPVEAVVFTSIPNSGSGDDALVQVQYAFSGRLCDVSYSSKAAASIPIYREVRGGRDGGESRFSITLTRREAENLRQASRVDRTVLRDLMRQFYLNVAYDPAEAAVWWERGVEGINNPGSPPYRNFNGRLFIFDGYTPGRTSIAQARGEQTYKGSFDEDYSLEKC